MENASKALIIAGAILISILIIALGVFIYQKSAGSAKDLGGLEETQVQSVNQKFENYEGKAVSGSDVRALIDLIRTNNNTYKNDATRKITVTGHTDLSQFKTEIQTGMNYTVKIKAYEGGVNKQYVSEISIEPSNS